MGARLFWGEPGDFALDSKGNPVTMNEDGVYDMQEIKGITSLGFTPEPEAITIIIEEEENHHD